MPAIRCQVLEVPVQPDWLPRAAQPRDLLPWADPYIAVLMDRLEERFDRTAQVNAFDESLSSADEPWSPPADYDWQDDAFRPDQPANSRLSWDPPVYGGWPLLDDM
jgi:hypothetical protein